MKIKIKSFYNSTCSNPNHSHAPEEAGTPDNYSDFLKVFGVDGFHGNCSYCDEPSNNLIQHFPGGPNWVRDSDDDELGYKSELGLEQGDLYNPVPNKNTFYHSGNSALISPNGSMPEDPPMMLCRGCSDMFYRNDGDNFRSNWYDSSGNYFGPGNPWVAKTMWQEQHDQFDISQWGGNNRNDLSGLSCPSCGRDKTNYEAFLNSKGRPCLTSTGQNTRCNYSGPLVSSESIDSNVEGENCKNCDWPIASENGKCGLCGSYGALKE